ncbi:WXG100 family type VII secretion target [Herpetosiphon llansteffanensis]|uniref:WXG100 family type VII secretion target n=1 Tax=Herpetosiphon llansteffanensis TaxID=2094568 RepID=UPI0013E0C79B|nr:WXG100 family type VII secretion target [Herpetosiphon llansteffanensis]
MGNEIVQIDYQAAKQVAQRFGKQQTQVQAIVQSLKQTIQALENGGWQGDAANACFKEFHSIVVPAYTRLCTVLGEGQSTMQTIATTFQQAEAEAAALFRDMFAATNGTEGGLTKAVGGNNGSSEELSSNQSIKAFSVDPGGGGGQPTSELETLIQSLKNQCVDPNVILDAIAKATVEERQAILNNPELMQYIKTSEGTAADVITAALLEGALFWPAASGPGDNGAIQPDVINPITGDARTNDFALWMRGEAGPPNSLNGTMNCWEATMYAAYLSGEISESQLREIHQNAANAGANYYSVIENALGANQRTDWTTGDQPAAGSIVFFEGSGSPLSHVAIATGRTTPDGKTEIMSLWVLPQDANGNFVRSMQRTTIEDLEASMAAAGMPPDKISTTPNPWDQPKP